MDRQKDLSESQSQSHDSTATFTRKWWHAWLLGLCLRLEVLKISLQVLPSKSSMSLWIRGWHLNRCLVEAPQRKLVDSCRDIFATETPPVPWVFHWAPCASFSSLYYRVCAPSPQSWLQRDVLGAPISHWMVKDASPLCSKDVNPKNWTLPERHSAKTIWQTPPHGATTPKTSESNDTENCIKEKNLRILTPFYSKNPYS